VFKEGVVKPEGEGLDGETDVEELLCGWGAE
jgi:hypothetical protein